VWWVGERKGGNPTDIYTASRRASPVMNNDRSAHEMGGKDNGVEEKSRRDARKSWGSKDFKVATTLNRRRESRRNTRPVNYGKPTSWLLNTKR
jgi:hypothetical protein